jgi:hypothetical protein
MLWFLWSVIAVCLGRKRVFLIPHQASITLTSLRSRSLLHPRLEAAVQLSCCITPSSSLYVPRTTLPNASRSLFCVSRRADSRPPQLDDLRNTSNHVAILGVSIGSKIDSSTYHHPLLDRMVYSSPPGPKQEYSTQIGELRSRCHEEYHCA